MHISNLRCIQIFDTLYAREFYAALEPLFTVGWSCICKGGIKHYLGNVSVVKHPVRCPQSTIDSILIFSQSLLGCEKEGQRAISIFYPRDSTTKISTFYLGLGLVGSLVVCPFFFAFEFFTFVEHIATIRYLGCYKLTAGVDGGESFAARKHASHIRHLLCIEVSEIERGESNTVTEHRTHIRHIRGIEVCDFKRGEF